MRPSSSTLLAVGLLLAPALALAQDSSWMDGAASAPAAVSETAAKAKGTKVHKPDALLSEDRVWVELEAPDKGARSRIANSGFAIEAVNGTKVSGIAGPAALQRLEGLGLRILKKTPLRTISPEDFPPADSAYHNFTRLDAELKGIASLAPELTSLFSIGSSVQGRPITALRLNSSERGTQASRKPGAVFLGTHHAREHISTEVVLGVARWIVENRKRADVAKLLQERDVYFIPLVNPDGSEYDIATGRYRWQRKNMAKNSDGSVGVDLNRNYDWLFGGVGTSDYPGDDTYHGPRAFSEPESRAVKQFCEARPNLKTLISYHSYSALVLYPWGGVEEPISDPRALKAYKNMAEKMASWTGYTAEQSSDLYPATGDMTDWSWGALKIFSFTIELGPASGGAGGFYPGPSVIKPEIQRNVQPVLYLIDLADDPYRAADMTLSAAAPAAPAAALAR
ncbi:MAG: M14 family metallopeptidase [Elusimicrobiota bacterium]|jgi:carboxypeptidase T